MLKMQMNKVWNNHYEHTSQLKQSFLLCIFKMSFSNANLLITNFLSSLNKLMDFIVTICIMVLCTQCHQVAGNFQRKKFILLNPKESNLLLRTIIFRKFIRFWKFKYLKIHGTVDLFYIVIIRYVCKMFSVFTE